MEILLSILSVIALLWIILGIPLAIMFGIFAINEKNAQHKRIYRKRVVVSLGGIPFFLLLFLLYFVYTIVRALRNVVY